MITKNNFKDLLRTLGFREEENTFQKSINEADLKVDFSKQRLIYPEDRGLIVNRRDTCNFSHPENFVVFECIHRLLKKGYKPEHLELEPTWRIGHSASGGRADILIKDQQNNSLLIIECKTAGDEFEKAWEDTRQDGGQLFSYAHQDTQTQYLCLYASSFFENELDYKYKLIHHLDNRQILTEDTSLLSFGKANKVEQRFAVWRDTYQLEFTEVGVFEGNIQAYQIGKNNYTLAEDTKPIGAIDKEDKCRQFQEILRKHTIARRENAFEVLVNLFLCKLVDEEENGNNLQFYWNGPASDNYFDFVDRLQNLYQRGMRKFLNEEISYISREQIDAAFWPVKNDQNATKKQIQEYFTELKFFSNSAFSFLDTHNRNLFNRNTAVLSEVVKMWQGLRLKTDAPNQFLGDMFELFLDNGVKQSEGQFFTPLPICKFIVSSLPLAQKIEENPEPIKAIDYACGSGHFLNEYAHQIKPLVENQGRSPKEYYSQITGIEKEDRLAKVAKVAAYMHGQGQIKIFETDTLAFHSNKVLPESFDVLVANPPYAVDGFLQILNDEDKKQYQLMQVISDNSNTDAIECFFLERIHHLMTRDGLVGVIVRDSILLNTEAVYTRTREILLQYFDLVSIVKLGNKTFGQTGTKTVVLFLRRKAPSPEVSDQYRNRVKDFFEGDEEGEVYRDYDLIKAYCNHIEVPHEEYIKLFSQTSLEPLVKLFECDIFQDYKQAFSQSTEIKKLRKSNVFKKKTPTERSTELTQRLIGYIHAIEKEKLYYFILAHVQTCKVLIVNTPTETVKEQKQFLGYWWSDAKINGGIKYIGGETVNDIITPLFDPKDLDKDSKINTAIRRNFAGEITDPLPEYCHYAKLTDMLDFSRVDFDKIINLTPLKVSKIQTHYPLVKLGDEIETIESGNRPKGGVENISSGAWSLGGEHIHPTTGRVDLSTPKYVPLEFYHDSSRGILKENDILLCKDGALTGKIALLREELNNERAMVNEHVFLLRCVSPLKQHYIFNFLFSENGQNLLKHNITGSAQGGINSTNLKEIKIPLPPPQIQRQIVDECDAVDQGTNQARRAITTAEREIEEKIQAVENVSYEMKKLEDIAEELVAGGDVPKENFSQVKTDKFNIPIFANGVKDKGLYGWTDIAKIKKPSITISARGTLGYTEVRNEKFYPIVRLIVLTPNVDLTDIFYLKHIIGRLDFTDSGSVIPQLTVPKVRTLQIPIPPLNIQKQFAAEVEQLEAKITEAQAVIDNATERKNAILTKYL